MAKYKLTGPDGRTYNVEAPDDATNDQLIDYVQKNYQAAGGSRPRTSLEEYEEKQRNLNPEHGGMSAAEIKDYEYYKKTYSPQTRRMELGVSMGLVDEVKSAGGVLGEYIGGLFGKDDRSGMSMGDRFDSHMKVQREFNRYARDNADWKWELLGGLASVGGAIKMGAQAAAPVATGASPAVKQFLGEFFKPKNLGSVAATGAAFGGAHSLFDTDGDLSARANAVPSGTLFGAAGGVALGGGLGAALAAKEGRAAAKAASQEMASRVRNLDAAEWQAAGVTPMPAEVSTNKLVHDSAPGLAQSWFGKPLRQQAAQSTDETVTAAQKLLGEHTAGRPSSDLGADMQQMLRGNLKGYSRTDAELQAMSNPQIEAITGPISAKGFSTPRPHVEPVEPRLFDPVQPNYAKHRPQDEVISDISLTPKYPKFEDIPEPKFSAGQRDAAMAQLDDLAARFRAAEAERAKIVEAAYAKRQAAADELGKDSSFAKGELGRGLGRRSDLFGGLKSVRDLDATDAMGRIGRKGWHPDLDEALTPQWASQLRPLYKAADQNLKELNRLAERHAKINDEVGHWDTQASRGREAEWKHQVHAERQRAEEEYGKRLRAAQEAAAKRRAEAEAEAETQRLRLEAERDAKALTDARQKAADEAWEKDVATGGTFKLGQTRESYPTEASAAYARLERELPGENVNPLGRVGFERGHKTETAKLMDDLLADARGALQLGGKEPAIGADGAIRPDLLRYARGRFGPDVTGILERLSEANVAGRGTSVMGMRGMRTEIGRAIDGARESGADAGLLRRLYDAVKTDLNTAVSRQGQPPYAKTATGESYDIDKAGRAIPRGGRPPDEVYYVSPEHAARLNKGHAPGDGAEMGFHPMRSFKVHTDDAGNKSLAVFKGEGEGAVDAATKIPFKTKPEVGLVPVELHDGGLRARIGAPINEVGVSAGERSANMMRNIDHQYREMIETMRKPLQHVFGEQVNPLKAMQTLADAATKGDLKTLRAFMRVATEKDDPVKAAATIIAHVTDGAKDLSSFVKGIKSIPAESRDVLFSMPAAREWFGQLQRLENIGSRLQRYAGAIEKGGEINLGLKANQVALASSFVNLPTMIAYGAGAHAAARFLSSPRYLKALTQVVEAGNGQSLVAFKGAIQRLSSVASSDGEIGQGVMSAIGETMRPSKAHASFVGENSSGVDKQALSRAKELERQGADRDAIWKQTGWFKMADGKWRTEIDDSAAELTEYGRNTLEASRDDAPGLARTLRADQYMKHDKLFEADPAARSTSIELTKFDGDRAGWYGYFDPSKKGIHLNSRKDESDQIGTFLHENQHAAQNRFKLGYGDKKDINNNAFYHRIPGEAEAYNVERRRSMTGEERWAQPPWQTMRVGEHELRWPTRGQGPQRLSSAQPKKKGTSQPQGTSEAEELFTTLEAPPSVDEARVSIGKGVRRFDIDVREADPAMVAEIKKAGGKITAYHVGGGGGREWKGLSPDEQVNKFDTPEALNKLTADVRQLVAKGADSIHFDNTHRMSGKRLEEIADAIKAGGAGFVAKNNADKWNLVMRRRPDLRPDYAVVEAAMHDADETQAAADLSARGVPVYIIGFKKPLNAKDKGVSDEYAKEYQRANPWARVILMQDEKAYEGRTAQQFK